MKTLVSVILLFANHLSSHAGVLNVLHLGPLQEINLEAKAGDTAQKFTLSHSDTSGPFVLPEKKASLRTIGDSIKALQIKADRNPRIAVLYPFEDSFRWELFASKPTPEKPTLRIINLSDKATSVVYEGKTIEIASKDDQVLGVAARTPVQITLESGKKLRSKEQDVPSAIVGFLYKEKEEWNIVYINDI